MAKSERAPDAAPSPSADGFSGEQSDTHRTLLQRPHVSIRTRIAVVFIVLFVLLGGMTATAVLTVSAFRVKLQLLDKVGQFAFEVQQARRYEKDFLLYRTNLADALVNVRTADLHLESAAEEITTAFGEPRYRRMHENLAHYERLLEELRTESEGGAPPENKERLQREAEIRQYGAQLVTDAEELIDQVRLAMHSALQTTILAAVAFLVFMFFVMAYEATFIIRAIMQPLARFVSYAERIGAGDFSPITPARKYRDEFSNLALAFNRMLRELSMRQDQLIQSGKMAAVGTLTSGIAHELNNPLNNIGITTEALIDGFNDYPRENILRMLEQIYTQVERASGTVRNLLDFTRREAPAFTTVSAANVIQSTLRLVTNELSLAGIELELDLDESLPSIPGNPQYLQQVFLNLFLNSVQAMPDGGVLRVRSRRGDENSVTIEVSDTGHGIPAESLDKIFDPFFTTKEPGKGTGIGLSVSYGIIEKHGGDIAVASTVGEGTTFTIHLPTRSSTSNATRGDDRRLE